MISILCPLGYFLMPFLPFLFVFSLLFAVKYVQEIQENFRAFVVSGVIASVSLLLMIHGMAYAY